MIVVYIAGPFRGKNDYEVHCNIERAEAAAYQVWANGMVALCPHNNTRHFDGCLNDSVWLDGDLELLGRCDAVLVVEGWSRSRGATAEVKWATAHNIPVFDAIEYLVDAQDTIPRLVHRLQLVTHELPQGRDTDR